MKEKSARKGAEHVLSNAEGTQRMRKVLFNIFMQLPNFSQKGRPYIAFI